MQHMKNIKKLLKKIFLILLIPIIALLCFTFKIKDFSICLNLEKCAIDAGVLSYSPFVDSLDLFVLKGGEGNATDYFLYDGFRIHCISDSSSLALDDRNVWDGKFEGNSLVYPRPHVADDVLLFRIRRILDLFYLVEVNENLIDITYWFFTNNSCKKDFVN